MKSVILCPANTWFTVQTFTQEPPMASRGRSRANVGMCKHASIQGKT